MDIIIYATDVRNFDEEVEKSFNIENVYGHQLFDENDRLTLNDYDYALEPRTYLSIMVDMQGQISMLEKTVEHLKNKIGWVSGYDDHRFTVNKSLEARITALETALFDGKNNSEQYLYGE